MSDWFYNKKQNLNNKQQNQFINGCISGICATIISHPFDSIKTALQTQQNINMTKIYAGVQYACVSNGIENMIVFGIYSKCKREQYTPQTSGFVAGGCCALFTTPFEYLKINKQLCNNNILTKDIINNIKILYNGLSITMLRESIGFSCYFAIYEYLSKKYNPHKYHTYTAFNGALSCMGAWLVIFPVDSLKTHIQSNAKLINYNYLNCYRGFHMSLIRAVPFHSTCFLVYEALNKIY